MHPPKMTGVRSSPSTKVGHDGRTACFTKDAWEPHWSELSSLPHRLTGHRLKKKKKNNLTIGVDKRAPKGCISASLFFWEDRLTTAFST